MNIRGLSLVEGERYHVCIYANTTTIVHEKWKETLQEVSVCSNGITVDTQPPVAAQVWIGHREEPTNVQVGGGVTGVEIVDIQVCSITLVLCLYN